MNADVFFFFSYLLEERIYQAIILQGYNTFMVSEVMLTSRHC